MNTNLRVFHFLVVRVGLRVVECCNVSIENEKLQGNMSFPFPMPNVNTAFVMFITNPLYHVVTDTYMQCTVVGPSPQVRCPLSTSSVKASKDDGDAGKVSRSGHPRY